MQERKHIAADGKKTHTDRMFGPGLNFSARESYKQLRTNLDFSFADQKKCHLIGVTSALRATGKSTTSLNLCYTLAESGKKVLLLEGDLRIPSVAKRMRLRNSVGLSNVLIGQAELNEAIVPLLFPNGAVDIQMDVLTAGVIPPNPSELLGSAHMEWVLKELSERYDYVICDLPPVTAVTDPLVVARLLDGVIVVVRCDYDIKEALRDTVQQLEFGKIRILGFVYTMANSTEAYSRYSRKYKYKYRYYRGHYRDYYRSKYEEQSEEKPSGDASDSEEHD